ncbi:Tm-1-like ATP-binding domain-containing protein [Devosia neptuniae]|uniref:UPF0261 protein N8A98_19945 n=1 Tax=Devosia neptuniae TaxID=191302 RepID=A0ABY6CB45_9HYPH|nr:Tm-1-like ATP-binding domain-containing protein [Devosia neptuniae]UXN69472.1 Tm-1-like ATP-binding domain-containing protein [Devosia neptuniae]
MGHILVVGTADTKGEELAYLASCVRSAGGHALVIDVGTRAPAIAVDIAATTVAAAHPQGITAVLGSDDRGTAVAAMGEAFTRYVAGRSDIAGMVGIGGGGGTSIVTQGMRQLPLGIPKLMVSTLASGDVSGFVGVSDIVMIPAITDMAGLNRLSRSILNNAGQAIAAMVAHPVEQAQDKPALGLTMFGVTTPCVTAIAAQLRDDYDCLIFHATGTGGRTVEKLADSGLLHGMLDITTTEVCDLLFGGVLPATEDRFGAIARTKLPCVMSVGAVDMINFWALETMPAHYAGRRIYRHNPNVTLMRTTVEENVEIGRWIGDRLNQCQGPVHMLLPQNGVSALDIEGGAFWDPAADAALFDALEQTVHHTASRRVTRLPFHINAPEFADAAVRSFREISPN